MEGVEDLAQFLCCCDKFVTDEFGSTQWVFEGRVVANYTGRSQCIIVQPLLMSAFNLPHLVATGVVARYVMENG